MQRCNAERVDFLGHLAVVTTSKPPQPLPLTVASMPVVFVPPSPESEPTPTHSMLGTAPYANPRVPDPCPDLAYQRMTFPSHETAAAICEALCSLENVNCKRIHFLPLNIVVELDATDDRQYAPGSLPAKVASVPTTYHHCTVPFLHSLKNHARERVINPENFLPGPMPQDTTDYLAQPTWGFLSPGMRISSSSPILPDGRFAGTTTSTTCGVLVQKGTRRCLTGAHHGFLDSDEVYHPSRTGDKVGDVVDRYPELDVAMIQLNPSTSTRFQNNAYFRATTPTRLVDSEAIPAGSFFEVDAMSTGLVEFMFEIVTMEKPVRPPGHPLGPCTVHQVEEVQRYADIRCTERGSS